MWVLMSSRSKSHPCTVLCCVSSYRKMVSNLCEGGLDKEQSAKQHNCPLLPPEGLRVTIKGQMLAVAPGDDITFIVHQERVGLDLFTAGSAFPSILFESAEHSLSLPIRATPAAPSIRWTWATGSGPSTRTWRWRTSPSSIATNTQAFTRWRWRRRTWRGMTRPPCTSRSQVSPPLLSSVCHKDMIYVNLSATILFH